MSNDAQQGRVLLVASALTCLLGGALLGGLGVHKWWRGRVSSPDFAPAGRPGGAGPGAPGGADAPRGQPAAPIRVDQARLEEILPEKPIVGRLAEVRKVTVGSEVTGKIVAMNVRDGSPVVGGKTVIASIDPVWLKLAEAQQSARIEVIKAQLRKEKHNLDRLTNLLARGVATEHEHTEQLAAHDQKEAELKEATIALSELQEKQKRVDILAPFDGWVTLRRAELGQWLGPGTPVVDMVSRGTIHAVMNVPESLVNGLKEGMKIPVTIDALGETRTGEIDSITPYGPTASRTYPVRVVLGDGAGRLKVGMSTTAIFPAGAKQKQIMVSRDAVLIKPDGATVWVVRMSEPANGPAAMTAVPVPVDVVARVGQRFAVAPASAEGRRLLVDAATVVVEGAERLRPNQAVRFIEAGAVQAGGPAAPPKSQGPGGKAPTPTGEARGKAEPAEAAPTSGQ